jgi:hypothetical protein
MKSKEALEAQVSGLESKIQELTNELSTARHDLGVIGKPTMTENVYELLKDTIRNAVGDFEFASDNFDWEPTWHGREVDLDYLQFNEQESMSDDIIRYIDREFRMIENEENPTIDGEE